MWTPLADDLVAEGPSESRFDKILTACAGHLLLQFIHVLIEELLRIHLFRDGESGPFEGEAELFGVVEAFERVLQCTEYELALVQQIVVLA